MMIRINLLPNRAGVKKREAGRQILVVFAGVIVLALIGNWYWYDQLAQEQQRGADKIANTQARIAELEKVIGEVNNINKRKKEVKAKLDVLDELRKGRSGPVRLLDALATATPKKVWITEFDEKSNAVKLTGKALSHDEVAELMRGLQNVVWTPKGLGRVVEQREKQIRVELIAQGAIEDFTSSEVGHFFNNIELKRAEQQELTASDPFTGGGKLVSFEIGLSANYSI